MFIRSQKRGERSYLQIVENQRQGRKVVQRTLANLGRLDRLRESGQLDSLLRSGIKFSRRLMVLDAHARGDCTQTQSRKIGAADVALKYKQLWMVEDIFRTMKSTLETRPVFHHFDETIAGHVFCSFLALQLRKQLQDRIEARGWKLQWADIVSDVDSMHQIHLTHHPCQTRNPLIFNRLRFQSVQNGLE